MAVMPSGGEDTRARNRRIRALRDSDRTTWTLGRLAREFGISKPRVVEILAAEPTAADLEAQLLERELQLRHELADRRAEAAERRHLARDVERRVRRLETLLDRIEEERQARDIDRLLGLA